ncbi:TIR domain-containing protein [Thioploca ingrica]|uniref:TIR domain-containing protein n=1 Tax=Thioploca ingrica TaxID=40754 RepID=A0A090BUX6_9GAMM|nr:TIR domain-containing protein [Thioploca ingrica]
MSKFSPTPFKDLFISYGRRESLGFVGRLHQQLKFKGYDAWFDKVNIPDGEDYAARINHGIESAHNFAYIMAPRCLTSPYCLLELEYARFLGKRVIPLNQMVIFQTPVQTLAVGDQQILHHFYQYHGLPDPQIQTTQDVLERSHFLIGKTDWLDAKEQLSNADCDQLRQWAQTYENFWNKHDDRDYLQSFEFPSFGLTIDPLVSIVERMITVLDRHRSYVHQHTELLALALDWQQHQRATHYLIVGKERIAAEQWLLTHFQAGEQPPCQPNALQCEFICEARKNAENRLIDVFVCYDSQDRAIRDPIVQALSRYAITTWTHDQDIQKGTDFARAIEQGIENADNFLLLISPQSAVSEYVQRELAHALKYHKRIIPLRIAPTDPAHLHPTLRHLQSLTFQDGVIDELVTLLNQDKTYHEQHKILLARALKWLAEDKKPAFLLRGYNLENAKTWLRLNESRQLHQPTRFHHHFINASEAVKGQLGTDVFISYSRKDGDFARRLNLAFQEAGKTTWFDQESISSGVDFETEIFKGIRSADNFLFILSPDAVTSEYCEREVNYAAEHHKRFIPVLWRDPPHEHLPAILQRLQWLDFQHSPFDKTFPELIQALELDRDYTHQHTLWQQRASDWDDNNRHPDFLLNKTACANALNWLQPVEQSQKQPQPTALQQTFIYISQHAIEQAEAAEQQRRAHELQIEQEARHAMTQLLIQERQSAKRQRIFMLLMGIAFVISLMAGSYAFEQKEKVEQQRLKIGQQKQQVEQKKQQVEQQKAQIEQALQQAKQSQLETEQQRHLAQHALLKAQQEEQKVKQALAQTQQQKQIAEQERTNALEQEKYAKHQAQLAENARQQAEIHQQQAQREAKRAKIQAQIAQQEHQYADQQTLIAYYQAKRAQQQTQIANYQASRAQQQTQIAQQEKGHAVRQTWLTQEQALIAQSQTEIANQQKDEANRAKQRTQEALEETQQAQQQTQQALAQAKQAEKKAKDQEQIAKQQAEDAQEQRDEANIQKQNAEQQRQKAELAQKDAQQAEQKAREQEQLAKQQADEAQRQRNNAEQKRQDAEQAEQKAREQEQLAKQQTEEAQRQREEANIAKQDAQEQEQWANNEAKRNNSLLLATQAQDAFNKQDFLSAAVLALSGLPKPPEFKYRPYVGQAGLILSEVLRKIPSSSLLLQGHKGWVNTVAFSPDGTRIVTASKDETAFVWNSTTGELLFVLQGHEQRVTTAAFSPDGTRIVTVSSDGTARVWDLTTGKYLLENSAILQKDEVKVNTATFSPDGTRIVTASEDGTASVWESATGKFLTVLKDEEQEQGFTAAVFSPNGKQVVTASYDGTALVWDLATGTHRPRLQGHEQKVTTAIFSPDGTRVVTASADGTARVWNLTTETSPTILQGHKQEVTSVAFSPDGTHIVTASADGTARVWDTDTGTLLTTLRGHEQGVTSVAFSPDGTQVVTTSDDKTARVWDVATGEPLIVLPESTFAAFSPDGMRIVTASKNTARVWNLAPEKFLTILPEPKNKVNTAAFSPDGKRIVTASSDKTARVWNIATGKDPIVLQVLEGHTKAVTNAAFSSDGARVVTISENTAYVWDVATGSLLAKLPETNEKMTNDDKLTTAAFSSDGRYVITVSTDKSARIWDITTKTTQLILQNSTTAAFSPDGTRVVTASTDGTAHVWDAVTGNLLTDLQGHKNTVNTITFSRNGIRVVTASDDGTARVWDIITGESLIVLTGHENTVTTAAFSPDGMHVVTASTDHTARVWDAITGNLLADLRGHKGNVTTAAFSSDGTLVVTASTDGTARVWDVATGEPLTVLEGQKDTATTAAFSPDGKRVVMVSGDKIARVWDIFTHWPDLIEHAWQRIWPVATPTQRKQLLFYLLDLDPAILNNSDDPQVLRYLWQKVTQQSFTPAQAQQQAWSLYLLEVAWERLTWPEVESGQLEAFLDAAINIVGDAWQPVTLEQRLVWQQWAPNYYSTLVLKALETVWNQGTLAQQQQFFFQLAAVMPFYPSQLGAPNESTLLDY